MRLAGCVAEALFKGAGRRSIESQPNCDGELSSLTVAGSDPLCAYVRGDSFAAEPTVLLGCPTRLQFLKVKDVI